MKKRLDQVLVEKGLFESRTKAQAEIMAGNILVKEQKIDKAGTLIDEDSPIRLLGERLKYVSRGGLKLEGALDDFKVDPKGKICLDIGASTGGFTDCLLQRGAAKVYAVDVGYGQLDLKIRNNKKVVVIEKTNARGLTTEDIKDNISLCVMDVSFISILKVLPALKELLSDDGEIVSLVKPQFEAEKGQVGKGGVIRDDSIRETIVEKVINGSKELGFTVIGKTDSPITGADGNKELFVHLKL